MQIPVQKLETEGNESSAPRPDQYVLNFGTSSVETNMTPKQGLVPQSQISGKSLTDYRGTQSKALPGGTAPGPQTVT